MRNACEAELQAQTPDEKGRSLISIMLELGLGLRQAGGGEGVRNDLFYNNNLARGVPFTPAFTPASGLV